MKNFSLPKRALKTACAIATLAVATLAASAGVSFTTGTGATNAIVPNTNIMVFPTKADKQFVLYNLDYRTATNGQLWIASGKQMFTQTQTNLSASAVTNMVNSTNGFVPGSLLVLEHAGVGYVAGLSAIGQTTNANTFGTNIVLAAGGWGVAASAGDNIYQLGTPRTIPVLAATGTNQLNGSAIFAGDMSRPVVVMLGPAITPSALSGTGEYR